MQIHYKLLFDEQDKIFSALSNLGQLKEEIKQTMVQEQEQESWAFYLRNYGYVK